MTSELEKCISTLFENSSESNESTWTTNVHSLYDSIKQEEQTLGISLAKKETLPKLFTDGMTAEQIWQQIDFQNNSLLSMREENFYDETYNLCVQIALLCNKIKLQDDNNTDDADEGVETAESSFDEDDNEEVEEEDHKYNGNDHEDDVNLDISEEEEDIEKEFEKNEDLSDFSDLDKDTFKDIALENSEDDNDHHDNPDPDHENTAADSDEEQSGYVNTENLKKRNPQKTFVSSHLDTKFFNLRESEWIADSDVIGENIGEEVDLMEDSDEDVEDGRVAKYDDFFDPPLSNNQEIDTIGDGKNFKVKSNFTSKLEEEEILKRKLEEETYLSEKPWLFKGEVQKTDRPENSTLEHHLECNVAVRLKPIITEETTKNIEKIILSRIKSQSWDDVERKIKPVFDPAQYKKKMILDHEKSEKSLAAIYEEEFMKKQQEAEGNPQTLSSILSEPNEKGEELPVHKEIKKEMQDLFMKLDALSNYHFTPKYKPPEVKVVSNLPAITIEESTPTVVSDATLLAPQEIVAPIRGELKGETEKEKTDKKRERRAKKKHQKLRRKTEEDKLKHQMKKRDRNGMLQTEASVKVVQKAVSKGQIKVLDNKEKSVKSSIGFFSEMQNNIANRTTKRKADDNANVGTGKKKKGNKPLTMAKLLL